MVALLVEAVLAHKSGLPKDSVVNSFCIATPSVDYVDSEAGQAAQAVQNFYTTVPAPSTGKVSDYIGPTISRAALACQFKVYDLTGHLDGSAHGSPKKIVTWTMPAGTSSSGLPSEVACAVSFHGGYVGDPEFTQSGARPRARDRGRVFIGPLINSAGQEMGLEQSSRPTSTFRILLKDAANVLMNDVTGAWSVWSRKNATIIPVVGGWVDDSYDTVRRRGEKALGRTTFGSLT